MSITDELREWMNDNYPAWRKLRTGVSDQLDRIDKAHEEALREAYTKGREDGMGMANAKDAQAEYLRGKNDGYDEGYDAGFASADDWCAQHEDAMAEHGWVKLPKDANGEVIHVGDAVTCGATVWTVTGLKFLGEGWGICCTVYNEYGGSGTSVYPPSDLRHYQPPTVEDVLREFAYGLGVPVADSYVAATAAKLQLREEA